MIEGLLLPLFVCLVAALYHLMVILSRDVERKRHDYFQRREAQRSIAMQPMGPPLYPSLQGQPNGTPAYNQPPQPMYHHSGVARGQPVYHGQQYGPPP